jgi:YfiR/HmsC-like
VKVSLRRSGLLAFALTWILVAPAGAEQMPLAAEAQIPLLLKVLTYDRNFELKAGAELALGIVHDPSDRDSAKATEEVGSTLYKFAGKTVKRLPLKYYTIEFTGTVDLERFVKEKHISVLYIAPGSGKSLAAVLKLSEELKLTTLTGVPDYVRRGVAVGIGVEQDKPQILINLATARAEGSDFDASLLRLAIVIGQK